MFADLNGLVAEWLGSGLQNRVQRFESARDLLSYFKTPFFIRGFVFMLAYTFLKEIFILRRKITKFVGLEI